MRRPWKPPAVSSHLRTGVFLLVAALMSAACGERPTVSIGGLHLSIRPADDRGLQQVVDLVNAPTGVGMGHGEITMMADREVTGTSLREWGHPEEGPVAGVWFRWATATEAAAHIPTVYTGHQAFVLHCRPLVIPDGPAQTIEVVLGETTLGSLTLKPGFRRYALPIPPGTLIPGDNLITLRFAYAEPPARYSATSSDRRTLAAAIVSLGFTSGDEVEGSPLEVHGSDLLVPPGSTARVRLTVPPDAVLDLQDPGPGSSGWVWIRLRTADNVRLLSAVGENTGTRWHVDLGPLAGEVIEVGFSTPPGAGKTARWIRPRLLCHRRGFDPEKSVILIVVDTLRADFVGCYGGDSSTPHIDALAAEGVRFTRAYSHIPITGPSHATIFSGRLPFEHGVRNNTQILPRPVTTLAETMRDHYRQTAGFISLGVLQQRYGFGQGFDVYSQSFGLDGFRDATEVTDDALRWLAERYNSRPTFLFVHYSDPHEPYAPPGLGYPMVRVTQQGQELAVVPAAGRTVSLPVRLAAGVNRVVFEPANARPERWTRFRSWQAVADGAQCEVAPGRGLVSRPDHSDATPLPAEVEIICVGTPADPAELRVLIEEDLSIDDARHRYGLEVEHVDAEIGRLVAALKASGIWDRSLLVLTSDHGEGLGDHELLGHISQLYDTLLHVPLALVAPGVLPAGHEVQATVRHVDLLPTILDLLGIANLPDLRGASLVPMVRGGGDRDVIAATYRTESSVDLHGVVRDGMKYIRDLTNGTEELYRLADDPDELYNLVSREPEVAARLRAWLAEHVDEDATRAESAEIDEEERARLRALGYIH